jgi:hypothetical protein
VNSQKIERRKRKELVFLLSSFFLPLALYIFTLAPGLLNDDPAEYQTILPALGVAHPTGYPLYTLVGHLFTRLAPLGDLAYRVNLFSAVCGAAAIAALYQLLRALNVAPIIALLGAFTLAVSADFWTYATIAQTYALNSFFIALTLWLFVRHQQRRDLRSLIALALGTGLGFAHHSTFWLLAPALAIGALQIADCRLQIFSRHVWKPMVAFALPLLFYLYIPLRGDYLMQTIEGEVLGYPKAVTDGWVTPHYLEGWTNVVMGSFYASSTATGAQVDWLRGVGDYLSGLHRQFQGFEVLALLALLPAVWRRNTPLAALLFVAWVTNVFVVWRGVSAFNEPAGGLYTPTYLFCVIGIVWSISALTFPRARSWVTVGIALCCVWFLWNRATLKPTYPNYRAVASQQLMQLQANAIVLGAWSDITPWRYLQIVEGVRLDVSVVHAPLTDEVVRDLAKRTASRALYLLQPSAELILVQP